MQRNATMSVAARLTCVGEPTACSAYLNGTVVFVNGNQSDVAALIAPQAALLVAGVQPAAPACFVRLMPLLCRSAFPACASIDVPGAGKSTLHLSSADFDDSSICLPALSTTHRRPITYFAQLHCGHPSVAPPAKMLISLATRCSLPQVRRLKTALKACQAPLCRSFPMAIWLSRWLPASTHHRRARRRRRSSVPPPRTASRSSACHSTGAMRQTVSPAGTAPCLCSLRVRLCSLTSHPPRDAVRLTLLAATQYKTLWWGTAILGGIGMYAVPSRKYRKHRYNTDTLAPF